MFNKSLSEALGYNEDGALIAMTYQHYGVSRSVTIGRDELGRNISTQFAPGGSVLRAFDGAGRLESLETSTRPQNTVGSFEFGYDPNSNITVIDQVVDGVTTPRNYVYDSENRLTQAQHGATTEVWNLDLLGNWTGGGRVFNSANQMIEDQNFFYSFDLRGNLIQKSAKIGTDVTNFTWDYFDRLVEVTTPLRRVSFKYDAAGRRTERLLEDLSNSTTKISRWTYLKEDQWTESNELNQVLAVTLNGESIDDLLALTVKDSNQTTPGIALEPIKDHLGSIYGWTNASTGTVIQKQNYTAYGETTIANPSPILSQLGSVRGFASREYDEALKLYFYRARYLDPGLGLFLSPDPIGFRRGDFNLYRYTGNNPVRYSDPYGLDYQVCTRPVKGAEFLDHSYIKYDDGSTTSWGPSGNPFGSPGQSNSSDSGGTCSASIQSSDQEDQQMKDYAKEHEKDIYNLINNNCHNFVKDVILNSGN